MFLFSPLLSQKVVVFLLNSVLWSNNCSIASVPPRMSIVSRPQWLRGPQNNCPNPPGGFCQQTLLMTTTPTSGGEEQMNPYAFASSTKPSRQSIFEWWRRPMPAIVLKRLPLVCQHKGLSPSIIYRLVPYARQRNGGKWGK